MYILYNILVIFAFIVFVVPYYTYRLFKEPGFKERYKESCGFVSNESLLSVAHQNCIWIHGASVGEIVATSPLVKEIKAHMPERKVLVSAFTVGGYNMAKQIIPEADAIIFFPLDLPWVAESVVERVLPGIFMPVETELWPNFLRAIKRRNIPVMMVNGRISEKSVKNYRYLYGIWDDMLNTVSRFCMQSWIDADYITHLGADKNKIFVTGNTKFDQTYAEVTPEDLATYKQELGIEKAYPVVVAGSTHPGEEEILFEAFKQLRSEYESARLVIAPRKVARAEEICGLAKKYGWETGLRSKLKTVRGKRPDYPVLLIDTIGELGRIYAVGDVVFVGGSFSHTGGHNVLEPAAHAKPILVGPSMENFKDSFSLLSKVKACRSCADAAELSDAILKISQDDTLRKSMGDASLRVIYENRGAAQKTFAYLKDLLEQSQVPSNFQAEYPVNNRNFNEAGRGGLKRMSAIPQYIFQLAHNSDNMLCGSALKIVLRLLAYPYEAGARLKMWAYEIGMLRSIRLSACVISVGNITVGGTGKTPTAQKVARMLYNKGHRVVILNRGYRSHWDGEIGIVSDGNKIYMTAYEAGDEAYLMAKSLPGIPVIIGKNRSVSGTFAVQKMNAQVIIMDDGYQHWQLKRDLDILLVDTLNGFGNGCVLPRGILREPLTHLDRAGIFLMTKADQSSRLAKVQLVDAIRRYNKQAPIATSVHQQLSFAEIADWYKGIDGNVRSLESMKGQKVMVFSALGNPQSFEQSVAACGLEIVEAVRYPDHHDYGMQEMQYINERAEKLGATAIITTGKDAVKVPTEFIYFDRGVDLYILNMDIEIIENKEIFNEAILQAVDKHGTDEISGS